MGIEIGSNVVLGKNVVISQTFTPFGVIISFGLLLLFLYFRGQLKHEQKSIGYIIIKRFLSLIVYLIFIYMVFIPLISNFTNYLTINYVLEILSTLILICLAIGTYSMVLCQTKIVSAKKIKTEVISVASIKYLNQSSVMLLYSTILLIITYISILITTLTTDFEIPYLPIKNIILTIGTISYLLGALNLLGGLSKLFHTIDSIYDF